MFWYVIGRMQTKMRLLHFFSLLKAFKCRYFILMSVRIVHVGCVRFVTVISCCFTLLIVACVNVELSMYIQNVV